jgi:hypothetical protein
MIGAGPSAKVFEDRISEFLSLANLLLNPAPGDIIVYLVFWLVKLY